MTSMASRAQTPACLRDARGRLEGRDLLRAREVRDGGRVVREDHDSLVQEPPVAHWADLGTQLARGTKKDKVPSKRRAPESRCIFGLSRKPWRPTRSPIAAVALSFVMVTDFPRSLAHSA